MQVRARDKGCKTVHPYHWKNCKRCFAGDRFRIELTSICASRPRRFHIDQIDERLMRWGAVIAFQQIVADILPVALDVEQHGVIRREGFGPRAKLC